MPLVKRYPLVTFFFPTYAIAWELLPVGAVEFVAGARGEPVMPSATASGSGISIDKGEFLA